MRASEIVIHGSGHEYVDGDALDGRAPLAITVRDVMSADECARVVERIDAAGPTHAPINTMAGFVMDPSVRNNKRVSRRAVGANERFRCYRYEPGERFAAHYDGAFRRNHRERSELTLMVYLNDGFGGGATRFHDFDVDVGPRTGMALLFQHSMFHEGCVVTSGMKYVLRSDVMYAE